MSSLPIASSSKFPQVDLKKNRELTWVTGVVLAVLTASFGATG